jgi:hypothetical protein
VAVEEPAALVVTLVDQQVLTQVMFLQLEELEDKVIQED